ncbi:hypothetical protein F8M41_005804 [Gigaspora margarita]|uniref:Uncharacterized protein n=1 Tax=Gigaspora margarita TaxID=4874 RepID=A0A8H3X7I7_GIGMA|nr:hypothetical protein F8M41_005804 [Gigaspora margarita]
MYINSKCSILLEKLYKFNNKKESDQVNIYTLTPYASTLDVHAIVSYASEVHVFNKFNADEFDQENAYTSIPYASTLSGNHLYEPNEFDQINAYTSILYASTLLGDHMLDELNANELDQDDTILYDSILLNSLDIQVVVLR